MKKEYLCFVAGRSGGHITPALTLAQHYKDKNPDTKIIFIATTAQVDTKLLEKQLLLHRRIHIALGNFPYKRLHRYPLFLVQLSIALLKSFYILLRYRPKKIIAMGGYISIPICIVGWLLRIPCELFELNVMPGKAAHFLAPFVERIAICFEQAKTYLPSHKCYNREYPIQFFNTAKTISKRDALATMTFSSNRFTIMILGGSQGSAFINKLITTWLEQHPIYHKKIQIIHQTGLLHDKWSLEEFYASHKIPAFVIDYHNKLEYCYQATDLIICRAGSGTLFEIKFFQKQAIIIPLETSITKHQYHNAKAMEEMLPTLFTVIKQGEVNKTSHNLNRAIKQQLQKIA